MDQRTSTWRIVLIVIAVLIALWLLRWLFGNFARTGNLLGSGLNAFITAFTGQPATSLTAISDLTGTAGNGEVTLIWPNQYSQNPNLVYYIYKGTAPGTETYYAQTPNTAYTDTNVINGRTYYYRVAPVLNNNGTAPEIGPLSNEVALTPVAPAVSRGGGFVASVPIIGQLAGVAGTQFNSLAWSVQSNGGALIEGYRVYRSVNGGSMFAVTTVDDTSYVDYNVSPGNAYTYNVRAFNRVGFSSPSNSVVLVPAGQSQITTTSNSAPGQIANLSALASIGQVSLIWSAPNQGSSPISYYQIYRGTFPGGESLYQTVNSPSFVDSNVINGTTYYYKVVAVNSVGSSPYSNEASATPTQPTPSVSAVTNLVASAGYSQITLAWSTPYSSGQITGYNIYRSINSGGNFSFYTQSQNNSYTDTSVSSGTTYFYYVVAVVNGAQSGQSNIVSASPLTQNTTPIAITNLSASATSNSINLSWSYPGNTQIAYYKIYRGTGNGNVSYYTSTGNTNLSDSNVSAGTTYFYQVSAVSSNGTEGPLSNTANANVPQSQQQQSNQATNLQATAQSNGIALSWSYNGANTNQFNVYRGTNGGSIVLYTTTSNGAYFLDTGVASGNSYSYQVAAVVNGIAGPLSNVATANFSVAQQPQTPSQVTNLSASAQSNSVSLTWSYSGPTISFYRIYRGVNNTSVYPYVTTNSTTYSDSNVVSGNTYYYEVSAVNSNNAEGQLSNEVQVQFSVQQQQTTQLQAPANLTVNEQNNNIVINWSPVSSATSYYIYRGTGNGSSPYYASTGNTSYTDVSSNLVSGTTYCYQVVAVNSSGKSVFSAPVCIGYINNTQQTTQTQTSGITETLTVGNSTMTVQSGGQSTYTYMYEAPVQQDGTIYVPVRQPVQGFGGTVNWNQDNQEVSITMPGGLTSNIWIGNSNATVGGSTVPVDPSNPSLSPKLDYPPGITMVPIDYLTDDLHVQTSINNNTITLTYP